MDGRIIGSRLIDLHQEFELSIRIESYYYDSTLIEDASNV